MALIDPLLRTTRSPIWVHPLLWRLDHLDMFRISVHQIPSTTDPHHQQINTSSGSGKGLSGGYIGSRDLRYVLQDISLLETYLAAFIMRTINTFQKSSKPRPFRYYSQDQRPKSASPLFTFANFVIQIHPELVVRTKKGFPFLLYNCAGNTSSLRHDFPNTRAGCDIEWSLKQALGALDFKFESIDPYDVAGLIALAQEQQALFYRSKQAAPEVLKVYLIVPHPSLAAVYLYTAKFPLSYLGALRDPELEVTETVTITREFVELPVPPATGQTTITSGLFLDMLAQVLGEALEHDRFISKAV